MKTYVLTKDQLRLAILIGAKEQGIVPDEIYIQFANSPSQIIFEKAENGASLSLPELNLKEELEDIAIYSDEDLKRELGIVMERPPGLNTIKSWTEKQKDIAWHWAIEKEGDDPRPGFIKERAVRGSKTVSAKVDLVKLAQEIDTAALETVEKELQDEFAEDVVPTPALSVEDAVASYFAQ